MLGVIVLRIVYAKCHCAEWHKCCLSFMLSVNVLSFIVLSVIDAVYRLCCVMNA
jgi:hypothetical protein